MVYKRVKDLTWADSISCHLFDESTFFFFRRILFSKYLSSKKILLWYSGECGRNWNRKISHMLWGIVWAPLAFEPLIPECCSKDQHWFKSNNHSSIMCRALVIRWGAKTNFQHTHGIRQIFFLLTFLASWLWCYHLCMFMALSLLVFSSSLSNTLCFCLLNRTHYTQRNTHARANEREYFLQLHRNHIMGYHWL